MVHPNDGSIWFTDPGYGSLMEYEGNRLPQSASTPRPLRKEAIYRIDKSGAISQGRRRAVQAERPVLQQRLSPALRRRHRRVALSDAAKNVIWGYDVDGDKLKNPRVFASMELDGKSGFADGIRCDEDGNVWSSAGWVGDGYDGVHIFAPDGARIGQIRLPEICSNVCFGGTQAQPAVHDRKPVALRGLCGDARRAHHVSNGFRGRAAGTAARPRSTPRWSLSRKAGSSVVHCEEDLRDR